MMNSNHWCVFEGCRKLPVFGYQGQRALVCTEHKDPRMVNMYEFLSAPFNSQDQTLKLHYADPELQSPACNIYPRCKHFGCGDKAANGAEFCPQHRLDILLQAATSI